MMEFANTLAFGLLGVLILIALLYRIPRRAVFVLPSTSAFGSLPVSLRLRLAAALPVLRLLAAVLLVVGIARPRIGDANAVIPSVGIDIILTLDLSSSMNATLGGGQTRLEATKAVVTEFIAGRPDDRIGLVVFQRDALPLAPPSLDHKSLGALIADLDSSLLPDGTGIGVGLASALNMVRESTAASRIVILLTDGEQNAASIQPEEAADLAVALNVRVYTVGVTGASGSRAGGGIDVELLEAIAERTGGRFFAATTADSLADVYAEIGELETSHVGRDRYTSYTELAPWFIGAAVALLVIEGVLRSTWLRRLPA